LKYFSRAIPYSSTEISITEEKGELSLVLSLNE
jgi:hypothetical protein